MAETKAAHGTGELYAKHGAWYGRWRGPLGHKRNRRVGPQKGKDRPGLTKPEARAKLAEMMRLDGAVEALPDDRCPSVGEVGDALVVKLRRLGKSASHVEAVESHVRIHIRPFFKDAPISKVGTDEVEKFIEQLEKPTKRCPDGHAPKSIRNYMGTLHSIFDLAIRKHYVTSNPCRAVDKPEVPRNEDIRFLTVEELEAVIASAADDDLGAMERVLWRTCAMAGLRMSETRGFRWRDVDWLASRLRVRVVNVRGVTKAPKSKRSSRSVPLAADLARALELLSRRSAWNGDDDLVFCHPHTGRPYDGSKALKRYKAACKRADVTKTNRLHDLRHTFGTQMAAAGVPMRTLQEWMGHRDIQTTMIYADYAPGDREAEWINAAFKPQTVDEKPAEPERDESKDDETPVD